MECGMFVVHFLAQRTTKQSTVTMTAGTADQTPNQGSIMGSPDADSLLATPEMDGASFEALMKERTRVSDSNVCVFCFFALCARQEAMTLSFSPVHYYTLFT